MPPLDATTRPGASRDRAGERALLVPEQLALDERGRQRAAVDRHEPPLRPRQRRGSRARRAPCRCRSGRRRARGCRSARSGAARRSARRARDRAWRARSVPAVVLERARRGSSCAQQEEAAAGLDDVVVDDDRAVLLARRRRGCRCASRHRATTQCARSRSNRRWLDDMYGSGQSTRSALPAFFADARRAAPDLDRVDARERPPRAATGLAAGDHEVEVIGARGGAGRRLVDRQRARVDRHGL